MSKSISWHKEKLMARLAPREKSFTVNIIQAYMPDLDGYITCIQVWSKKPDLRGNRMLYAVRPIIKCKSLTNFNVVLRALEELVNEGKLRANISLKEFTMQIALGTAPLRKISREV
jgi:PleD family two-component response regulator